VSAGLVLGFITGLTYGLLAVGIVLIFRASRFINLAHAQLGIVSALLLGRLVLDLGMSYWLGLPLVLVLGVGIGLVIERVVIRRMLRLRRNTVSLLLVSVGVAQLLLALAYIPRIGPSADALYRSGYPVPFDVRIEVGSFLLRGQHVLILILVPAVILGLTAFLRWTILGKTIRAAATNPDAARLCGVSVTRVSAIAWGIAGGLSALTAVLQAPSQGSFNAAALGPALLLRALGAAALGGFTSIPAALVGGVVIAEAEHITLALRHESGSAELLVFLTVVAILFARGRVIAAAARTSDSAADESPARPVPPAAVQDRLLVRHAARLAGVVALLLALLVPLLPSLDSEARRFQLVIILVMAIAGVSLTMLVGWAGQVSLGHFAVLGFGAYLAAKLGAHDLSLPLVLVIAGLLGAGLMALVGLPALRLRGLTLAVTTLGLAVVAPAWLFHQSWLGAQGQSAVVIPRTGFVGLGHLGSQLGIYYAALALLLLTLGAAAGIRRNLPGLLVLAVRDNERAVSSFGVAPTTVKLMILAISGGFVAMAGVIWGTAWQTVSVDLVPPGASLVLLAIPVIGGLGSLWGAVAGALFVYVPAFFISPLLTPLFGEFGKQIGFQLALAGLGLVVMPLMYPGGLAGIASQKWQRYLNRLADDVATTAPDEGGQPLSVAGISKRFGGLKVLEDVSIEVGPGEVVGLIGPNGAGKTTLMNIISGDLPGDAGTVCVHGRDVSDLPTYFRAHLGLGRNYQDATLFAGLTTREVIQVALSRTHRVGMLSALLAAPWARWSERRSARQANEILQRFGLQDYADVRTAELSTGTRRICELAAQVASAPKVLLLDEPTAGVAQREAEAFGPLLRRIREELDCSIVIIEHDMPLLMSVCDRVYALSAGSVIAEGPPEEIRADPQVIATYLGTSDTAVARSGATAATMP
jgi:ABC-type branched-subunit amino acid transport system ATPase component/ABC-type branched-subunit amino acid transport system permease subunit